MVPSPSILWGQWEEGHKLEPGYQTLNLLAPWSWTSQPPELWEVQFMAFCYSSPTGLTLFSKVAIPLHIPPSNTWGLKLLHVLLSFISSSFIEIWLTYNFVLISTYVLVAQSCPTLCNPMDYSPQGSSVHGIFQARMLEWFAILFSRGSSLPRGRTWASCISCITGRSFTIWATRESLVSGILQWFDTCMYCKIITTVSLVTIYHLTKFKMRCDENF